MAHNGASHIHEKSKFILGDTVAGFVVQDAVRSDGMPAGTADGNTSVKSWMRWIGYKGIVPESVVLGQVVDNQGRVVMIAIVGVVGLLPRQPDCIVIDALRFGNNRSSPLQAVMVKLRLSCGQGRGTRGFGKNEAVAAVEEGYQASTSIQSESAQLSKGGQGLVIGGFCHLWRWRGGDLRRCQDRDGAVGLGFGTLRMVVISEDGLSGCTAACNTNTRNHEPYMAQGREGGGLPVELALLGPVGFLHVAVRFALEGARQRKAVGHGVLSADHGGGLELRTIGQHICSSGLEDRMSLAALVWTRLDDDGAQVEERKGRCDGDGQRIRTGVE